MGKQATNTAYKARSALRMLSLEADDVQTARFAVRSLLSDMGVESGLWSLPDLDASGGLEERGRCFPFSIPLADFDHLLHHVMEEVEGGFSTAAKELWDSFDAQLSALSKVFSKRDHIESWQHIAGFRDMGFLMQVWESPEPPLNRKSTSRRTSGTTPPSRTNRRQHWHQCFLLFARPIANHGGIMLST